MPPRSSPPAEPAPPAIPLRLPKAWDNFIPEKEASPHVRLCCTMHNIILSPLLHHGYHFPGPYFTSDLAERHYTLILDIKNPAHLEAFTSSGLDGVKDVCFLYVSIGTNDFTLPASVLLPNRPGSYSIMAEAVIQDSQKKTIIGVNEAGQSLPISTTVTFAWARFGICAVPGYVDPSPNLNWKCLIRILQHQSAHKFKRNGDGVEPDPVYLPSMSNASNPLKESGYLGFPGMIKAAFSGSGNEMSYLPSFRKDDGSGD